MGKTVLSIAGTDFYINGKKVYEEIQDSRPEAHGLLMNARFIQGIFDDSEQPERFNRFGRTFDPEQNTDDLIAALPEWYAHGLRAFTVGLQGGGPCFTLFNEKLNNNPFDEDGTVFDPAYAARLDRLIRAADEIGMVVIVCFFYFFQAERLRNGRAVLEATRAASRFLKQGGYTNVIIEIANEHDLTKKHSLLEFPEGIVTLMEMAKQESGGMLVGCSSTAPGISEQIAEESDIVFYHGNGRTRQQYYNDVRQLRSLAPDKPILCNEDSQALGNLEVAFREHTSWGYYNNLTKQEPPTDWGITEGEDRFFAYRMAKTIGITLPEIPFEEQYYLQGLEKEITVDGKRWIRLASVYPETIDYVEFYRNDELEHLGYDEPFFINFVFNWYQSPVLEQPGDKEWKAVIHLKSGEVLEKIVHL
ncbi:hypothetical protein [Paenibacillus riograndensis]|uniref:Glycoside hydrolase family 5 domain-containing protein n=3 Tax=Paenibacillus riograndensis TaxID=483937 RepID=A0A0E4CX31_9BACL|nr:hypothetical protein [Paenibacillus riograndensis]CQR55930.1 hypothetical protein PRIO_3527 [Paenibacillus riograndensis SBR5]